MIQGAPLALAAGDQSVQDMIRQLKPKTDSDLTKGAHQGLVRKGDAPVATPATRAAPATGHATAARSAPATDAAAQPTLSLTVPFASGSADLMPSAIPTLRKLGAALSSPDLAGSHFRIEGHTDTVGTAEFNRDLSERRAVTVSEYLEKNFNIPADRIQTVGLGFDQPAVTTPPDTPEPRNRRVQIVNTGG
ncbi:MAG TPA: OmpA family protein [Rhodopila sp.]|nr:OmpA family protein [Rhodopila sp.]